MSKILCVLLLAGAVVAAFFQQIALSNARTDNRQLREDSQEAQRLARENAAVERLRAGDQDIEKLRNETRELHKLRNEVRQLREQKPAWDKLRTENQRLRTRSGSVGQLDSRAPDPASLIAKEMLSDAGLGSPEATLRTFLWAMREGNLEKMRSCFSPDTPDEQLPGEPDTTMATFKGFRVVAKKVVSTDEAKLGIQFFAEQGAAPVEMVLPFKRVDGEWKVYPALSR
jgi:hypothetical protein